LVSILWAQFSDVLLLLSIYFQLVKNNGYFFLRNTAELLQVLRRNI